MQTLIRTLSGYDLELLHVIANRWDVDLGTREVRKAAEQLAEAMLQAEKVSDMWSRLPDDQRGALQTVLGAGGKMPVAVFGRMFGAVRPMGPDRLMREKPHLNPENIAEALYYRGLIASTFAEAGKSTQAVIYVPTDLALLMPIHLTSYALAPEPAKAESVAPMPEPENIRLADTTLVDDLTTLLAGCQVEDIPLIEGAIPQEFRNELKPHFLGSVSAARMALLVALAVDLGLVSAPDESGGLLKPAAQPARQWLDAPRPAQVRALAETWKRSLSYNELWFTPGLKVERAQNDPLLARQAVLNYLELVPPGDWWSVAELVDAIHDEDPDFQRPDGDYDSWYIRDAQGGQYLRGFENWAKVDGAMLRFILTGPMHGLGLVDVAAEGAACRLTAYGRALIDLAEWPTATAGKEGAPIRVHTDGLCLAPRSTSRYERFQLARFTDWVAAGDPYQYRLSADSLSRARRQGIRAEQVTTFLRRVSDEGLPETLVGQIELWGQADVEGATLTRVVVLRLPKEDMLASIMNTPSLRRYLGTALGPTAITVRPGQWEALIKALRDNGIAVDSDVKDES